MKLAILFLAFMIMVDGVVFYVMDSNNDDISCSNSNATNIIVIYVIVYVLLVSSILVLRRVMNLEDARLF
jgi:hypothetical protein